MHEMARRSAMTAAPGAAVRWWPAVVVFASGTTLSAAVQFSEFQFSGRPTPKFTSVGVRDAFVYGLDERILTCIDLSTGARCWKGGRYGYGQLILVDDLLLIQGESGEVALVETSPARFQELGRFAALKQRTWNHPALAGRLLLVRNDREAACYALPLAN
jgi:hypothetical protein